MIEKWFGDVFSHPDLIGGVVIAAKTAVIYVFLVIGLRLLGKRELGQMTVYDVVLLIILANSVQNAMVGSDTSLAGGLVAAITLLILNRFFNIALVRSKKLGHLMTGEPLLIVSDGHILKKNMDREGLTRDQLMAALREHGICSLEEAKLCVLEIDGTISVVPTDTTVLRTRRHFKALRV